MKAVAKTVITTVASRVAQIATAARNLCTRVRQSLRARVAIQVLVAGSAVLVGVRYYAARQFTMAIGWAKCAAHSISDIVSGWVRVIVPAPMA